MNQEIPFAVRGERADAVYLQTDISAYDNNPFIEALPPILSNREAIFELSHYPDFAEKDRYAPNQNRYHIIQNGVKFFSALDINLDLERRFSLLLRVGYTDRNPTQGNIWIKNAKRLAELEVNSRSQYKLSKKYKSTAAIGFNIIGISGIGKSQTVERILQLYPQVIDHNKYNGKNFTHSQLVWLKLDCPFDGSIKGLCYNFFLSVDNILGTNYFEQYVDENKTVDQMMPNMARVAANHFIGVLVIDEIQRLSKAKSGGAEKMLDFFVELVNTIKVPVVLVGTFKALSILSGSLSQMRRGSGQGDLVWDRMKFDDQWQLFVEDLWEFQYVQKPCGLQENPKLSEVLYEESQGITDLAIKLFMFSQELAITSGAEKITGSIILSAAKNKFNLLQPALKALKSKQKKALDQFEDIYPSYLKELEAQKLQLIDVIGEISNTPEIRINLKPKSSNGTEQNTLQETPNTTSEAAKEETSKESHSRSKKRISKTKNVNLPKDGLLEIHQSINEKGKGDIYEALKEKGFIQTGDEFNFKPQINNEGEKC